MTYFLLRENSSFIFFSYENKHIFSSFDGKRLKLEFEFTSPLSFILRRATIFGNHHDEKIISKFVTSCQGISRNQWTELNKVACNKLNRKESVEIICKKMCLALGQYFFQINAPS